MNITKNVNCVNACDEQVAYGCQGLEWAPCSSTVTPGGQPISSASNMSPPGGFSLERYYSARTLKFTSLSYVMMESTGRPYKKLCCCFLEMIQKETSIL